MDCPVACEGVYADVEWEEDTLTEEAEGHSIGRSQKTQDEIENKGEELDDRVKFIWILKMYKEFKKDYVRILRFNCSASIVPFGKNFIEIPTK